MTPEPEGQAALRNAISTILTTAVQRQLVTGLYVMTAGRIGITYSGGAGTRDGTNPLTEDTIALLASMTKPIVAVAALQLVERGLIELDTPLPICCPSSPRPTSSRDTTTISPGSYPHEDPSHYVCCSRTEPEPAIPSYTPISRAIFTTRTCHRASNSNSPRSSTPRSSTTRAPTPCTAPAWNGWDLPSPA